MAKPPMHQDHWVSEGLGCTEGRGGHGEKASQSLVPCVHALRSEGQWEVGGWKGPARRRGGRRENGCRGAVPT